MNRREFVKAGAGAFFIASAGRALGDMKPSNRVRLAVMGCHAKGRGIGVLSSLLKVPGVEVAWVCDVDSRAVAFAAGRVKKLTGVAPRTAADIRKVLEDPTLDGIVCEAPDHWHAYAAYHAMNAGKAVYVEKPCCFCPAEGERLVAEWKRTGQVFQMGNQRRSSHAYRAAIAWAHEGKPLGELKFANAWYNNNRPKLKFGAPCAVPDWLDWDLWQGPAPRTAYRPGYVHYNWHWTRRWGTAESGNNAPHFLDIARWTLGVRYPVRVVAGGGSVFSAPGDDYAWPDTFNLTFEYPGGKVITWNGTSRLQQHRMLGKGGGVIVYGTKGSLFFTPDDEVIAFDTKFRQIRKWRSNGTTDATSLTAPTPGMDVQHLADFVECVRRHDQRTHSPADEAVVSSDTPLVANIALLTGETMRLDPETGALRSKAGAELWSREYEKGWAF